MELGLAKCTNSFDTLKKPPKIDSALVPTLLARKASYRASDYAHSR